MEINRVAALIFLEEGDLQNASRIINDCFVKAASMNICGEVQCNILLAYGKIYRRILEVRGDALKKLNIGLNICENFSAFKSGIACKIYKSKFLK
jgi:hypothetical protein